LQRKGTGKEIMILEHFYFQKKTGHNRGPPQQTYYLGSILLMKKTEK
jgi:hypothetical protein